MGFTCVYAYGDGILLNISPTRDKAFFFAAQTINTFSVQCLSIEIRPSSFKRTAEKKHRSLCSIVTHPAQQVKAMRCTDM